MSDLSTLLFIDIIRHWLLLAALLSYACDTCCNIKYGQWHHSMACSYQKCVDFSVVFIRRNGSFFA